MDISKSLYPSNEYNKIVRFRLGFTKKHSYIKLHFNQQAIVEEVGTLFQENKGYIYIPDFTT